MKQNDDNNYENQDELESNQSQSENKSNGQKLSENAVKGVATAAGGFIGGKTGAAAGSNIADGIINKTMNHLPKSLPSSNIVRNQEPSQFNLPKNNLKDQNSDAISKNKNSKINTNEMGTNQISKVHNPIAISPKKVINPQADKNPSKNKHNGISKKFSNHADGSNEDIKNKEQEKGKKRSSFRKKNLFPNIAKKSESQEEPLNDSDQMKKDLKQFGNALKFAGGLMAGILGALGAIGTFIITHIVLISIILIIAVIVIFISTIIALISSFLQYGKEDDGTVCYVTPSCNQVVIKSDAGDKTYSMNEYIAGAIVNYYEHDDYAIADVDVDQNLLKAFSVVIHSDIAAYSDYNMSTETCTVNNTSKFTNIYVPTNKTNEQNSNGDNSSGNNSSISSDSKVDAVSGADAGQNTQTSEQPANETQKKDNYYSKAKTAADSVISEVVDIYTQRLNIFYDGYKSILNTSSATGNDYKQIIRDYIKGSPDYEEVASDNNSNASDDSLNKDDTTNDDNNGEVIGIYPVCDYQKSTTDGEIGAIYTNDVCSNVHINNGTYAGDHTIDEFIAGVVYHEMGAWNQYPELMKAQAVAARTYLVNRARVENGTCYIEVGNNTLGYSPNNMENIKNAVSATSGQYIMINGQISKSAEWDALCVSDGYTTNTSSSNYTICQQQQQIPKTWFSEVKLYGTIDYYNSHSHGRGMSQYGAYYLASKQNKSYKEIINYYYGSDVGTAISESKDGFVMPINTFSKITGETTGYCGSGDYHSGIDFAAAVGTPIFAAHDGIIVKTYDNSNNCYPNCDSTSAVGIGFRIDNQDGTISTYMHMSQRMNLPRGTSIKAGQLLGYVGNTGSSTGPHLHYGMLSASTGAVLNPRNYLPLDEKGIERCYNYK